MIIENWREKEFIDHVFVSGCFDILHAGHIKLLNYAASFGPLLVGVNSDNSVFNYKSRYPIMPLVDRIAIVNALSVVDKCFGFDCKDARDVVRCVKPKLWVLGDDHKHSIFVNLPCPVKIFERDNHSSTKIRCIIGDRHAQKQTQDVARGL